MVNLTHSALALDFLQDLEASRVDFQSSLTHRLRDFHFFVSFTGLARVKSSDLSMSCFMKYFSRNFYLFIVEKTALNGALCRQYKSKV